MPDGHLGRNDLVRTAPSSGSRWPCRVAVRRGSSGWNAAPLPSWPPRRSTPPVASPDARCSSCMSTPGGDPAAVAGNIRDLLDTGSIDAVTGWHLSTPGRPSPKVVGGRVPYVYAAAYEGGGAQRRCLVQRRGARRPDHRVAALVAHRAAAAPLVHCRKRLCGRPRGSAMATRMGLEGSDISILGERFVPLGADDPCRPGIRSWPISLQRTRTALSPSWSGRTRCGSTGLSPSAGLDATMTRFSPFYRRDRDTRQRQRSNRQPVHLGGLVRRAGLERLPRSSLPGSPGPSTWSTGPDRSASRPHRSPGRWPRPPTPACICWPGSPPRRCRRSRTPGARSTGGAGIPRTDRSTCSGAPPDTCVHLAVARGVELDVIAKVSLTALAVSATFVAVGRTGHDGGHGNTG